MDLEKDEIIVNLTKVKAALFDKLVETATECDDSEGVVVDILTAREVLDIVESCGSGVI